MRSIITLMVCITWATTVVAQAPDELMPKEQQSQNRTDISHLLTQTLQIVASGDYYDGDLYDNKPHGQGIYTWANGDRYEGGYWEGRRHGYGVYYYSNGDHYEGTYWKGKLHGYGVYTWANGDSYQCVYREGILTFDIYK